MSYSLSEINRIRHAKKPTASDLALLREIRYELATLVSYYDENDKHPVDLSKVRYNNLSIESYITMLANRETGEKLTDEDVEAIYNTLDAASVYCFGTSLREDKSPETIAYGKHINIESNFEQVVYYMLTHLALHVPVKFPIYKEYWKGNNFSDYANAVEKMEEDREVFKLTLKIYDDNIKHMIRKSQALKQDGKKSTYSEVDIEVESYCEYVIDKHLRAIDKMERKADKIRYKKVHPSIARRFKMWIGSFKSKPSTYNPEVDDPYDRHNW